MYAETTVTTRYYDTKKGSSRSTLVCRKRISQKSWAVDQWSCTVCTYLCCGTREAYAGSTYDTSAFRVDIMIVLPCSALFMMRATREVRHFFLRFLYVGAYDLSQKLIWRKSKLLPGKKKSYGLGTQRKSSNKSGLFPPVLGQGHPSKLETKSQKRVYLYHSTRPMLLLTSQARLIGCLCMSGWRCSTNNHTAFVTCIFCLVVLVTSQCFLSRRRRWDEHYIHTSCVWVERGGEARSM